MGKISGVVDVKDGIVLAGDALNIKVDRVKASLEGVDPEYVTRMLGDYLSGAVTTRIQRGPKMVGVRVWIPGDLRATEQDIRDLRLRAPDGHLFPLTRIASLTVINGEPQIMRDNLKQMIAVTARISGRDMGSVIRDVKAVLRRPGLVPDGVYYDLGGLYAQQQIAFTGLMVVFAGAVMLVFALLLFLYESFRVALAILAVTLLAVSAVFMGLWVTGTQLNISSMMGMTMIVGIVTEVAIFYVSEFYDLSHEGKGDCPLILAGKNRMRPIAMTTLVTIFAHAAGPCPGPGIGHAATPGHRHHLRSQRSTAAGADCAAGFSCHSACAKKLINRGGRGEGWKRDWFLLRQPDAIIWEYIENFITLIVIIVGILHLALYIFVIPACF